MPMKRITSRLKSFLKDTRGSVAVEFVIITPILFWAFGATYVFFDGYRQSAVNLKAAYTISDLISRETGAVNDTYIDSMYSLLQMLTRASSPTKLRVTVIRWNEDDDRYYVDWSADRGYGSGGLTDADMPNIKHRLPTMPDAERVILVETRNVFQPPLNVGLEDINLDNFVFTRPRFAPQVVWES